MYTFQFAHTTNTNRSESPSQVFFILVQWLVSLSKLNEYSDIHKRKMFLAYDNMCNLARLKVAQNPLPLPPPLDKLWMNIEKIIDVFHFKNHVSPDCHRKFSPANFKAAYPDYNTQAGEQTFVWIHRYNKILCSMNKTYHLFYLHRRVLRRNMYILLCVTKEERNCSFLNSANPATDDCNQCVRQLTIVAITIIMNLITLKLIQFFCSVKTFVDTYISTIIANCG